VGCFSCGSAPRPRCSHARSIFLFITFLAIFPFRGRQTSRIRRPSTLTTTTTTRCAPLLTLNSSAQAWVALPCPALPLPCLAVPRLACAVFLYSLASTERAAALRRPTHGPHPQTEHLPAGRDIGLRLSAPAPSLFSRLLAGAHLCHF
jgi:hypothetical protein